MKKTKYNNNNIPLTVVFAIILIIILIYVINSLVNASTLGTQLLCSLILLFIIIGLICGFIGFLKGKTEVVKENQAIKNTNPYIYYRELPNNYGIGVATLLVDSTLENYKDIVAVILDLCAKKYLKLIEENSKYTIKVLKNDDNLLSNEKYILSLIINNDIRNIDYKKWYSYCIDDGIALGLYYPREVYLNNQTPLTKEMLNRRRKTKLLISTIVGILCLVLNLSHAKTINAIIYSLLAFGISYILLSILFYLLNIFILFKHSSKMMKDINYKNVRENTFKKTAKGIDELHKLYSFKAFLNDFGAFVNKNPEEVVLWDRYLSYAQVFGLTRQIMQSGYKQLVDNASFKIDDIDNITFDNIEIDVK